MWNDANDCNRPPILSRQPSIYSLTFDEFQSTMGGIGKDLGSMNMDEFLKSLWTAEETQNSLSLPRTLSVKTVDEVWRDVIAVNPETDGGSDIPKQATINEMTLEEFLVRAGVVREEIKPMASSHVDNCGGYYGDVAGSGDGQSGFGLSFHQPGVAGNQVKRNGDITSLSSMQYGFKGALRGRKLSNGAMEKVFERRQRRMIKNRESAARSRAKKQAYTMELEAELATLKEKNQELEKKQAEVFEMQKKQKSNGQILELLNRQLGPKRSCLRRTFTGPW